MSKVQRAAHAEHHATKRAAKAKDRPAVRWLGTASEVADQPPLVVLSVATAVAGALLGRPAVARAGVRMLAAHALATGIKTAVKKQVDRTRPAKALRDGHRAGKGSGAENTDYNSFPSGHTAGAVAVAQGAARDLPAVAWPARIAALAVGGVQMPRGKHYLSDVAAGALIGWASEALVSAAARRLVPGRGSITKPVLAAHRSRPAAP